MSVLHLVVSEGESARLARPACDGRFVSCAREGMAVLECAKC